ncbi:Csu type fimbrial protein [Azotobacter armeniacus]
MNEKKSSLKMLRKIAWATSIALAGSWATATHAQETADLEVSATVEPTCSITTTALAFGIYDFVTANNTVDLDEEGAVEIICTLDAPVTITLGQGLTPAGGSTAAAPIRQMNNGTGGLLTYHLYSNAARTLIWGDDATVDVEAVGTGVADEHIVYGQIPAGQNVPSGAYVDTVVATVDF